MPSFLILMLPDGEALQPLLIWLSPNLSLSLPKEVFLDAPHQVRYLITKLTPQFSFLALGELRHYSRNCHCLSPPLTRSSKKTGMALSSLTVPSPGPRTEFALIRCWGKKRTRACFGRPPSSEVLKAQLHWMPGLNFHIIYWCLSSFAKWDSGQGSGQSSSLWHRQRGINQAALIGHSTNLEGTKAIKYS